MLTVINQRLVNWTVVPRLTARWARLVYGLGGSSGAERLWAEIGYVAAPTSDPAAAWAARGGAGDLARRLAAAQFDALHSEGRAPDLVVGLFPGAEWETAREETVDGIQHMANLPSEEVYNAGSERTEGFVRSMTSRWGMGP